MAGNCLFLFKAALQILNAFCFQIVKSEINRQVRVLSLGCEFCHVPARVKAITGVLS